ncbi:MAG: DUF4124 domain-containing protein, partial [Nevskiaceae bacterium]|nr:DUF4124 domain-containing protein [Nevskiaceae bacterium]
MRDASLTLAFCCALLLTSAAGHAASSNRGSAKPTYKWVDANGVTHYGDSIPPEYAQGSRTELNEQGVEIRQLPARLSPEAAAAAEQAAADEARRRQRDAFLLNTYVSAQDIEQLRDERIALVDSQLTAARTSIESVDGKVESIAKRMANFKPYSQSANARRLPDALAEEAVRALQDRRLLDE